MRNERQSALSGRLTIAQRLIAGKATGFATQSVKRTTEKSCHAVRPFGRPLHGLRFHFALENWQRAVAQEPLRPIAPLE